MVQLSGLYLQSAGKVAGSLVETLQAGCDLRAIHFLARDGVQARKRNLDACKTWNEARAEEAEIQEVIKRIKGRQFCLYQPFPHVPAVSKWLEHFTRDLLRYPLLILLGASASGKTEYAKSLFQQPLELKVGSSEIFPAKMVEFKRGTHDALILDDET